jgi:hypothetical protein
MWKSMEDLEEHPELLSTCRQYHFKGHDISLAQDQVEEAYQPNQKY